MALSLTSFHLIALLFPTLLLVLDCLIGWTYSVVYWWLMLSTSMREEVQILGPSPISQLPYKKVIFIRYKQVNTCMIMHKKYWWCNYSFLLTRTGVVGLIYWLEFLLGTIPWLAETIGSCFKIQNKCWSFPFKACGTSFTGSLLVVAVCCSSWPAAEEDMVILLFLML